METRLRTTSTKATKHESSIKVTAAVAGQDIEAGVKSPVITVETPVDVSTVFWKEHNKFQVECTLQITIESGHMTSVTEPHKWMKNVQISGNCHEQNLQITYDSKGNLILQAIRNIAKFEPLYAWFSMETSKTFNIPFLGLKNIQGDQQYKCHYCDITYQNPNPLKIHLAFCCSAANVYENPNHHLQLPLPSLPTIKPSLFQPHTSSYSAFRPIPTTPQNRISVSETDLTTIPSYHPEFRYTYGPIPHPYFPFSLQHLNYPPNYLTHSSQMLFDSLRPTCCPIGPPENQLTPNSKPFPYEPPNPLPNLSLNPKVTTSNERSSDSGSDLSKSIFRRRHKCNYCGKMYSRKYGLKIHIRTHTGYKPLQCKVCQRPFGDPSNLNKHVRLHAEGTTPYKCHLCGKVLVRRRDLERHLKSRHQHEKWVKIEATAESNESHTQTTTSQ